MAPIMTRIVNVQIYAVAQAKPEFSWSPVMPEVLNTDTIVRLTDENGQEGFSSVCTFTEFGADNSVLESLRPIALNLLQAGATTPEEFWHRMQMRRPGVSQHAIAAVDIALWDLIAKQKGQPLYQLLGGTRHRIPAYASVPILDGPDDYIALIEQLRQTGFSIFKFHYKSIAEPDIDLIKAVSDAHGEDCQFMFDAENLYDLQSAKDVADIMAEHGHIWLEAPFDDHDWASYKSLRNHACIPIIPAGNSVVDKAHLKQALDTDCWDAIRIDAATAGGISPSLEIFNLAKDHGLNLELQSWGSSISTAANLHLALAHNNSTYFEIPVPRSDFTVPGTSIFDMTLNSEVIAPTLPGIGINVNWDTARSAASSFVEYQSG